MDEATNSDLLPSFILGRYRVEGITGDDDESEVGVTLHAFDTRMKRMVTIRALRPWVAGGRTSAFHHREQSFLRELEAGSRLPFHTNLVAVLDLEIDSDETQYLVLEHAPEGTLAARLAQGALPRTEALRIAADAARGLAAAHAVGIVHCTISPSTIALTNPGRAKVGSFGYAQFTDATLQTQALVASLGNPLYLSPEQVAPLRPATDQYSLALVLFAMLTGVAYKQMSEDEAMAQLRNEPLALSRLLRRMLATRVDDRFPSMDAVANELDELAQQSPMREAPPPGTRTADVWSPLAPDRPASAASAHSTFDAGQPETVVVAAATAGSEREIEHRASSLPEAEAPRGILKMARDLLDSGRT